MRTEATAIPPMPSPLRTTPAPACPGCGVERDVRFAGLGDRILEAPGQWQLRACPDCGLLWLDPQPHPEDLGELYRGPYMTHAAAEADDSLPALAAAYVARVYGYPTRSRRLAPQWLQYLQPLDDVLGGQVCWLPAVSGGRLLDVGCGSGALLVRMRQLGWTVYGVEPDPAAADLARRRGLQVVQAIEDVQTSAFDAITFHHVIEHLPDPDRALRDAAARLRPGGRVVVVTPNPESLGSRLFGASWVHLDPPRHLRLLSTRALARMAEQAGLRVDRCWATGRYARFAWAASRGIQRSGRATTGRPGPVVRLSSMAFQLLEQLVPGGRLGEEAVLVARRPA